MRIGQCTDTKKSRTEGEYLNGKGKEYHFLNGNLIFEGEYLKGHRWNGKFKQFNFDDELKFEGEYLNGIFIN